MKMRTPNLFATALLLQVALFQSLIGPSESIQAILSQFPQLNQWITGSSGSEQPVGQPAGQPAPTTGNPLPQFRLNLIPQQGGEQGQPLTDEAMKNIFINPQDIQYVAPDLPNDVGQQIIEQLRQQLGNQPISIGELQNRNISFSAQLPGIKINRTVLTNVQESVVQKQTRTPVYVSQPPSYVLHSYRSGPVYHPAPVSAPAYAGGAGGYAAAPASGGVAYGGAGAYSGSSGGAGAYAAGPAGGDAYGGASGGAGAYAAGPAGGAGGYGAAAGSSGAYVAAPAGGGAAYGGAGAYGGSSGGAGGYAAAPASGGVAYGGGSSGSAGAYGGSSGGAGGYGAAAGSSGAYAAAPAGGGASAYKASTSTPKAYSVPVMLYQSPQVKIVYKVLEVCNGKPVYGGGGKDYGKIYNNLQQSASEVKNAVKDGYSQLADVSALIEDSLKQLKQLQKSAEEYNQMASSMVDQMNHAAYVAPNLDQYSNLVNYGSGGAGGYGRSNGATAYRSPPAAAYAAAPGAAGAYGGSSGVANAYGGASGGGYGGAGSVAYGAAAGGNGAYGGSVGAYAAPAGGAGAYGGAASGGAYAAAASSGNAGAYSEGSSAGKAYEVGGSSGYSSSSYTSAPKAQSAGAKYPSSASTPQYSKAKDSKNKTPAYQAQSATPALVYQLPVQPATSVPVPQPLDGNQIKISYHSEEETIKTQDAKPANGGGGGY